MIDARVIQSLPDLMPIRHVARLLHVSRATVTKWFDSGLLEGCWLPGGRRGNRRISRDSLLRFLRKINLNTVHLPRREVLLVTGDAVFSRRLQELLPSQSGEWGWLVASTPFQAAVLATRTQPEVVILDFTIGRTTALDCLAYLKVDRSLSRATVLAIASEDENDAPALLSAGFDRVYRRPCAAEDVIGGVLICERGTTAAS